MASGDCHPPRSAQNTKRLPAFVDSGLDPWIGPVLRDVFVTTCEIYAFYRCCEALCLSMAMCVESLYDDSCNTPHVARLPRYHSHETEHAE